ncbi:hypothetical protein EIP86_008670 [Pleurotus ostreatoroseus]|nr:hypothetical protein EIP86_008670 [Pleurotus ostreatoroseus]
MLSPAAIVFTSLALAVAYAYHKHTKRVSPTIPYAGGQTAARDPTFLERLQAAGEYAKDPVSFLAKTRSIIGDVFCVDLIVTKIVFLLGPDGNKELFRAPEDKLSFEESVKWSLGPTIAAMYDFPGWTAASMRLLKQALLRQEKLDGYYALCSRVTETIFDDWEKKGVIPLFHSISHLIISNLLVLIAGEGIYSRHGEELIPMMAQFERDVQKPILRVVPWSLWRFTGPGAALFRTCNRFDTIVEEEMRDILANPDKHAGRSDYLYFLVTSLGPQFGPVYGRHVMSIIFGGHANAALTIPWLFLHARRVPGALDKIREEAILPRGEPKAYLEACMRETGRLYTNTAVMRMTKETTSVAGHVVPKGILVAASPAATQRSEPAFVGAEKWNPSRFFSKHAGEEQDEKDENEASMFSQWFQRAEFVQFGMGQHACPGEKMARMFIFDLVLRNWMEKYDMEVISGVEEGVKGVDGVGVEAAWTEENFGTPSVRGEDVMVRVERRY